MDAFTQLDLVFPEDEDALLQQLLESCAPSDAASASDDTASAIPTDEERYGSGNMTYFCVVA